MELPGNPQIGDAAFDAGGTPFLIDGHSETKGGAKEPQRVLINFFVDDLQAEQKRLEGRGVRFIRTAGREEWGGVISTFLDPDGNYCQLIEYKPAQETPS
jgi:predicted enzyme related to lactoylglutathione lyase